MAGGLVGERQPADGGLERIRRKSALRRQEAFRGRFDQIARQ